MNIKRYDLVGDMDGNCNLNEAHMEISVDGVYVKHSDYAELEARCAALAAESAALNNFIATSCYVWAGEDPAWHPAIDHSPETPATATNQLSVEESQFLTDVITAAGLLSHGKQDKKLARRIADFCVAKIGNSDPAQLRQEAK